MIILFTSNTDGGIVQFAIQLTVELYNLGIPCLCFLPNDAVGVIPKNISKSIIHYEKFKAVSSYDINVCRLADIIISKNPRIIWYVDSSILSDELCFRLSKNRNKLFRQVLTIHDPYQDHPTNYISFKERIKRILVHKRKKEAIKTCDNIMLLSHESGRLFEINNPEYSNKMIIFNLGAHIPAVEEKAPAECNEITDPYFLFFGRIDKYKGIENLLQAFSNRINKHMKLIIAGKGKLSETELDLLSKVDNTLFINRYITDEEQIWLFQHAKALVLPYIEASQSGIIPIAYKYGIPVIVSNIPGLTQFVINRKTGIICNNNTELTNAIDNLINSAENMRMACIDYYNNNLEWRNSIHKLLLLLEYNIEDSDAL